MQHPDDSYQAAPGAASASSTVWASLAALAGGSDGTAENAGYSGQPGYGYADQQHAEEAPQESGPSNWGNWKNFVTSWMKDDGAATDDGVGVGGGGGKIKASRVQSAYSTGGGYRKGTSFVSQLAEQQALISHVEADLSKQPKKSALKAGKSGNGAYGDEDEDEDGGGGGDKTNKKERFEIQMPSLSTNGWEAVVHQVVWKVGRHFGFQAFNANPKTRNLAMQEYTPASIFIAADHLTRLLCSSAYIRRGVVQGERDEERFAKALAEFHATIFYSYEQHWCKLVKLPWRTSTAQKVLMEHAYTDPRVLNGLLCELALWFLIYSESSSIRHTPELMWFIYWCMSSSHVMADFWHRELPEVEPNMRDRRIELRNLHQKLITEIQSQLQIYPRRVRPEDCGRISSIITRLMDTDVEDEDFQIVAELIAFGDGGFYVDRIISPIFDVIAYEVDHLATLNVDVAHRIGYDDFNESMCVRAIVHSTLRELRVKPEQLQQATVTDAYTSLTNLGFARGAAMSKFEVAIASDFWHTKVFVKTYRERRTWAAVYRAYFRVWCFHIVAYQFLQVLAFTGWDWRMLSSCIVTHALMKAFERFCNWFMTNEPAEPLNTTLSKVFTTKGRFRMSTVGLRAMQRMEKVAQQDEGAAKSAADIAGKMHRVKRRHHVIEGRPLYGIFGFIEWQIMAASVTAWYILQFYETPLRLHLRSWWGVFAASYCLLHIIHFCLTLRDGYIVSLTHMLNMPAILKASSPRGDATCWMSAPMHMKWKLLWTNALFWFVVFAMKLPFDYFVICKPVVIPLQVVTQRHWLPCKNEWWIEGRLRCINGDWMLLAGRVCPFVVIIFMDTALFYQITITIFGIIRGLFKLDLGVLTSWDEVVKEFYRAPARWWHKCMSQMGNDNQLAQLKMSMLIEDGNTGQVTQVSDGMMFKKTVLTPEEIMGKKVHFNGRRPGSGNASEGGVKQADAVVDSVGKPGFLTKIANKLTGEEKKGGGVLLPSSTNRTKTKTANKDMEEKKKKEEERRKEAEARAVAKKAAIAAGKGGMAMGQGDDLPLSRSGPLPKMLARAVNSKPTSDGEPGSPAPSEGKEASGKKKGMFGRLMSSNDEDDPVAKMAADAAKLRQSQQKAGSRNNTMARGIGSLNRSESGLEDESEGQGVMGKLTRLFTRAPDQGDDIDKMARAARMASKTRQGSVTAAMKRPMTASTRPQAGGRGRPMSAAVKQSAAFSTGGADREESFFAKTPAQLARQQEHQQHQQQAEEAASASQPPELLPGDAIDSAASEEPDAVSGPIGEGYEAIDMQQLMAAQVAARSSALTAGAEIQPMLDGEDEGPLQVDAAADEQEDDDDVYLPLEGGPVDGHHAQTTYDEVTDVSFELGNNHGFSDENHQAFPQSVLEESDLYSKPADGPGLFTFPADSRGQALGEAVEDDEEHAGSAHEVLIPIEADSDAIQAMPPMESAELQYMPVQLIRKRQAQDPNLGEPAQQRQPRVHRRVPTQSTRVIMGGLPMASVGPAALWWTANMQSSPQQDGDSGSDASDSSDQSASHARGAVRLGQAPSGPHDVRINIPMLGLGRSNRVGPGPLGEGVQDDWTISVVTPLGEGTEGEDGPLGALPPLPGVRRSQGGGVQHNTLSPRAGGKAYEEEIDELFGRPIDREPSAASLGKDERRLPPLPHTVPPTEEGSVPSLPPIKGAAKSTKPKGVRVKSAAPPAEESSYGASTYGEDSYSAYGGGQSDSAAGHSDAAELADRAGTARPGTATGGGKKKKKKGIKFQDNDGPSSAAPTDTDKSETEIKRPGTAGAGGGKKKKKKEKRSVRILNAGPSDPGSTATYNSEAGNATTLPLGQVQDFDAANALLAAVPQAFKHKRGNDEDGPLLGKLFDKISIWKKKDAEDTKKAKLKPAKKASSKKDAGNETSMQDQQVPQQGLTAEDLEIDDVHYQMMMWNAFANAWDEVVDDVRQSDLISDKEVGMLKFVRLDLGSRHYGLRSILLPTFFYAGQIRIVVDTGSVSTAQIMVLNELRVLCVWMGCQIGLLSGKHAHVITSAPFYASNINVKHALHRTKFYKAGVKLIELLEDMFSREEVPFDMREYGEHLYTLLTSMESECFAIRKAHELKKITDDELELSSIMLEVVQEMKREISKDADHLKVIFKNALSTSATATWRELLRVTRVIKRMLVATVAEATPTGEEAQRALGFFINSLSHPHLDRPTSLDKMWCWTILTPLYEEDVLYPLEGAALAKEMGLKKKKLTDLLTEGADSISLMNYLKSTFPDEWENFKERMKTMVPDVDVKDLSEMDFAPGSWLHDYRMELQLWASCRGQLLGRTVNGMMRNEKALRVLAKLEHPRPPHMSELDYHKWIDTLVQARFEMVITPQTYGKNRDSKDVRLKWLARSIDLLLQRYPKCLKAAFLEKADIDGMGITEFSVCLKGRDPDDLNQLPHLEDQPVYEMYRVRLPANKYSARGVIVGEGKPENQNHAVIFAHGEGIQAIDMNQDGYLCEWLKFRNLLAELQPSSRGDFYLFANDDTDFKITPLLTGGEVMSIVRYRMFGTVQTVLVGFREYIFSEAAGALGRFAAATEYAFGTISQRTMTHPARIRLHYGHPDLFNKLFVMTRGGISKATRLLHLTEDVFCGCNHTLRGGRIRYKEYISCGKGRDMGFDSINGFNFKIAGGGGEWAISRESYRMGTRLDFFRLMAFYHAAVGFYINSWFTYLAVYLNVYALLLFAWAQATEIQAGGVQRIYNVQQVLQLGTLALIPYAGQLMLENGVIRTCLTLFQQIATGSLLFYTFQQQTVAASFSTDMTYGSGKYVGTGRGFNIVSLEFVKIFTLYARSHLYMAFELIFALATLYIVRDCPECNYGALTWSSWLLAVTLLFSPLWFNPFSFDMSKVHNNYLSWRRWMDGDVDHTTGSNWYTWNNMQLEKIRNDNGNNTDDWLNHLGVLFACTPYILMALASASRMDICLNLPHGHYVPPALCNGWLVWVMASAAIWGLVYITIVLRHHWMDLANHKSWRIYTWMVSFGMIAFMLGFLIAFQRILHGRAIDVIFLVLYSNFNILIVFHKLAVPIASQNNTMRAFCDWFYYTVDTWIGYIMFIVMGLLSFIGVVGVLQMKLLFNDTFSEQVKHSKIGRALKDQKIGFDAGKGQQMQGPPGSAVGGRAQSAASAASGATAFTMRSLVQSEHRRRKNCNHCVSRVQCP